MTYYNIKFKGVITFPQFTVPSFYTNYADQSSSIPCGRCGNEGLLRPLALTSTPARATNALNTIGGTFGGVYSVIDARVANVGAVQTDGLDFYARYTHDTGFGDIYADIAGTYILSLKTGGTTGSGRNERFRSQQQVQAADQCGRPHRQSAGAGHLGA